jgi:hypothetical protein
MQSIIIEQLYQYILENVGKIGSEVANIDIFSGKGAISDVNVSVTNASDSSL